MTMVMVKMMTMIIEMTIMIMMVKAVFILITMMPKSNADYNDDGDNNDNVNDDLGRCTNLYSTVYISTDIICRCFKHSFTIRFRISHGQNYEWGPGWIHQWHYRR